MDDQAISLVRRAVRCETGITEPQFDLPSRRHRSRQGFDKWNSLGGTEAIQTGDFESLRWTQIADVMRFRIENHRSRFDNFLQEVWLAIRATIVTQCVADAGFNGSSPLPFSSTGGRLQTTARCRFRADTTSLCLHGESKRKRRLRLRMRGEKWRPDAPL